LAAWRSDRPLPHEMRRRLAIANEVRVIQMKGLI
jgi:hypothetical protein